MIQPTNNISEIKAGVRRRQGDFNEMRVLKLTIARQVIDNRDFVRMVFGGWLSPDLGAFRACCYR